MKQKPKTIFMGTTDVPAKTSREQILSLLIEAGAANIALNYTDKRVDGLSFSLLTNLGMMSFSLPLRIEPIFRIVQGERVRQIEKHAAEDMLKAERVAWRQLLRWLEAQMALVDLGMVESAEVFMPYTVDSRGSTMFETFKAHKLLEAPKEP